MFWDLLTPPYPTTQFIMEAMDELNKVFYANDRHIDFECSTEALKQDFAIFLDEYLGIEELTYKTFNLLFESPNNVAVMDIGEPFDNWANPYTYTLQPKQIRDIEVNSKGEIELLIFIIDDKNYGVLDDTSYRQVQTGANNSLNLIKDEPHELGYCPARHICADMIEGSEGIRRIGLLMGAIARMDDVLMGEVLKKSADLYAAYPIMQKPEEPCDVEGCEGGYITRINTLTNEQTPVPCPSCSNRKSVGPGSVINVPTAAIMEGVGKVVNFVNADVAILEYYTKELDKLKESVFTSLTGGHYKEATKQQLNEKQVQDAVERRRNKNIYIGELLEEIHEWYIDTSGKLRYANAYKGSIVKYGTEFYFETLEMAIDKFQKLKNAGSPQYIVEQQLQVIETLFSRNNSAYEKRSALLRLLEPYRSLGLTNLMAMPDMVDPDEMEVKIRFGELIDKFELENGSIVTWGAAIDLKTKVERIKQQLYDYVTASRNSRIRKESDSSTTDPRGRQPVPRTSAPPSVRR